MICAGAVCAVVWQSRNFGGRKLSVAVRNLWTAPKGLLSAGESSGLTFDHVVTLWPLARHVQAHDMQVLKGTESRDRLLDAVP